MSRTVFLHLLHAFMKFTGKSLPFVASDKTPCCKGEGLRLDFNLRNNHKIIYIIIIIVINYLKVQSVCVT
jgi:hypothetical protein